MENVLESSRQPRMDTRALRDRESLDSQASAVVSRTDGSYLQRLRRKPRGDPNTTLRLLMEEPDGRNEFPSKCSTLWKGSDDWRLAFQENIAHTSGLFFDDPEAFTVRSVKPPANDDHRYSNLLTALRERGLTVVTNQYYETPDFCHYIQSTVSPRPLAPHRSIMQHIADRCQPGIRAIICLVANLSNWLLIFEAKGGAIHCFSNDHGGFTVGEGEMDDSLERICWSLS
jgi:hypothetical protein